MIRYSVVIPTNRTYDAIVPLLDSLSKQTLLPSQIIIVYDQKLILTDAPSYPDDIKKHLSDCGFLGEIDIVDELSTSDFIVGHGASYVRNFGRSRVTSPYMMFIDDDNRLDIDACERLLSYWEDSGDCGTRAQGHDKKSPGHEKNLPGEETIIVPLQASHDSHHLIACLAQSFNFLLCRPRRLSQSTLTRYPKRYCPLMLVSSNCLVGPTALFAQFPFDESVPFVYEDMILSGLMSRHGVKICADTSVTIHHYHAHRSKLAHMYIDTPQRAYYKAKHRIILVQTIGNSLDKIIFYTIGLRGHTLWLLLHIVYYAPVRQRRSLWREIIKGTYDGLTQKINITPKILSGLA